MVNPWQTSAIIFVTVITIYVSHIDLLSVLTDPNHAFQEAT